ncbi:MAG: hypothetical protein KDA86_16010 [Planctomycetaceae bacterium]|nr:hypothetical protein [Planctomycetaceae bacterium]
MQHLSTYVQHQPSGGCRIASNQFRNAFAMSQEFAGLEEGANRYELLLLAKKLGKLAGFTPATLRLLDYYFAFCRDIDWEEGSRAIVYQSLSRTALDLGVTERHVQNLEKALADLGAVTFHDSGNYKRYGQRDPKTGRILFAFGIDLSPLAAMRAEMEEKLRAKKQHDGLWMETKRQISFYRSQLRGLLAECREEGRDQLFTEYQPKYEELAIKIRTHLKLPFLQTLLERHRSLHSELVSRMGGGGTDIKQPAPEASSRERTQKCSARDAKKFVHYQTTTQQSSVKTDTRNPADHGFQKSVPAAPVHQDLISSSGVQHVKLSVAIRASSQRFRDQLPEEPDWRDVHETAYRIRSDLGISQEGWGEACQVLGRTGAALCTLITDQATHRHANRVRQPAAYFRGMIRRARDGRLHLHKTIFGLASVGGEPSHGDRPQLA